MLISELPDCLSTIKSIPQSDSHSCETYHSQNSAGSLIELDLQVAKLSGDDMNGINNLEYLGISVSKKQAGPVSLKFRQKKVKMSKHVAINCAFCMFCGILTIALEFYFAFSS